MKIHKNLSAEEKLLNVIEKRDPGDKSILDTVGAGGGDTRGSRFILPIKCDFGFNRISLRTVNKALIVLLFIGTITLGYFFAGENTFLSAKFDKFKSRKVPENTSSGISFKKTLPALEQYLDGTEKNNPFHILPVTIAQPIIDENKELELALVGIFWDDKPQAVIENSLTKHDYMVYEGDSVEHFVVKKITSDTVHLVSNENGNEKKILR